MKKADVICLSDRNERNLKMPNNQIQIAYNPYKKKIQYRYRKNSDREWEPLHGNGKLTKQEFCEGTLQNKASEIIQALLKDYCAKNTLSPERCVVSQDDYL